jgi:hypothetical protein
MKDGDHWHSHWSCIPHGHEEPPALFSLRNVVLLATSTVQLTIHCGCVGPHWSNNWGKIQGRGAPHDSSATSYIRLNKGYITTVSRWVYSCPPCTATTRRRILLCTTQLGAQYPLPPPHPIPLYLGSYRSWPAILPAVPMAGLSPLLLCLPSP